MSAQLTNDNKPSIMITTSQPLIIKHTEFDPEKVGSSKPLEKNVPNSKNNEKYKELPLCYNYGTPEASIIDSIFVEYPKVRCPGGILVREEKDQRLQYSVKVSFDPINNSDLLAQLGKLYEACAKELEKNRGFFGCFQFQAAMAETCGFKNPVYYHRDQMGNIVPGRRPTQFIKLIKSGTGYQSLFTDPTGQPIDWKYLVGTDLEIIPLVIYEKIYYGGKPSLQCKLKSCVVVSASKPNTETTQISTISQIKEESPDVVAQMQEAMRKLREAFEKKSSPDTSEQDPNQSSQGEAQQPQQAPIQMPVVGQVQQPPQPQQE